MESASSQHGLEGDELMSEFVEVSTRDSRRLTSDVWNSFKKSKKPNGELVAVCNHCGKNMVGNAGTSHLRMHLKRKHKDLVNDLDLIESETSKFVFDQERSRKDLATMIIKHNYPLSIVDHEWFQIYSHGLNPEFNLVSRNTIRADIMSIHKEEKEKLYAFLDTLSSKITLTTDIWTSDHQNIAYTCLTAHYIDDNWELKKKILAYRWIEYPHDGETLYKFISDLILEWNIDKKLFAMVVDNASANDVMVRRLRAWLQEKSLLNLGGDLFHVRCSAHILNLVVQDGLKVIHGLLEKIRLTVRYLRTSTYAKQRFDNAVNHVKLKGRKKLPTDVSNRWNSTYTMLDVAISMREALGRLSDLDRQYQHNPSNEEWEIAIKIKDCLEEFYNATNHFSGRKFPTSNVFFPDICELQLKLSRWENNEEEYLWKMAMPMKDKFVKYWDECCLVLAVGIVFDPRFKLKIVRYYYNKIYGNEGSQSYITRVCEAFDNLYKEYNNATQHRPHDHPSDSSNMGSSSTRDKFSAFDEWCEQEGPVDEYQKSEADTYLEEPLIPRVDNFCILGWWKANAAKYPILSKVARDVLAVPATTVASESAFSVGGRKIDETRASMLPELVEALVTTDDWIESTR